MGIKSFFIFLKSLKVTFFSGWISGWHGIIHFYNDHTLVFYAIIIIILLIVVFVIYLEINSQEDYLIRPYKVLLGISLIAIVIYIIASAPEQKGSQLERFKYSEIPQSTIDDLKYPYEDEETWIKEGISCQSLEEEKKIQYCLEIKETCSEFIPKKDKNMKPFSTCVSKSREIFGIPPSKKLDIFGNEITAEGDVKINWATLYDEPYTNFEAIEERWKTSPSDQKLKIVRNILATGTTYDQFPDWMKNDPAVIEIKEELQKSDNNQ